MAARPGLNTPGSTKIRLAGSRGLPTGRLAGRPYNIVILSLATCGHFSMAAPMKLVSASSGQLPKTKKSPAAKGHRAVSQISQIFYACRPAKGEVQVSADFHSCHPPKNSRRGKRSDSGFVIA